ncbi:hypothetical protein QUA74_09500 [Microcoleus sp. LAD1_D3]|uniref:hypothetical protein n=1 Tax=Microcoleus sp. LAD1_D3 TaxID=2819365 RepID=UPI002FD1A636
MKRPWRVTTVAKVGVTGVRLAVQAGEGIHFVRSHLSRTGIDIPPRKQESRRRIGQHLQLIEASIWCGSTD